MLAIITYHHRIGYFKNIIKRNFKNEVKRILAKQERRSGIDDDLQITKFSILKFMHVCIYIYVRMHAFIYLL